MDAIKKLLEQKQRENGGARASNRFNYQQVWALSKMIELIKRDKEFILFMEVHDDVIILDKREENIEFFQVKSNDKSSRYITKSFITENEDKYPRKMSIFQKMIINFNKFSRNTKNIYLVSNKYFDFKELVNGEKSTEKTKICLNQIEEGLRNELLKKTCKVCNLNEKCGKDCHEIIYFNTSNLGLENYEITVLGEFVKMIEEKGIETSSKNINAMYNTILGEVRRINNFEKSAADLDELLERKSISNDMFDTWLKKMELEFKDVEWNEYKEYLLADGVSSIQVNKIGKQFKIYRLDSLDIENKNLQYAINKVKDVILKFEFDNIKLYLENVYSEVNKFREFSVYKKEYIQAMIVEGVYGD